MYTWSGSYCATRLFSSPGWRADKEPGAGARSWLYLPGAEGWSTPDESHRQLHQERADRMCSSGHREGMPDTIVLAYILLRSDHTTSFQTLVLYIKCSKWH